MPALLHLLRIKNLALVQDLEWEIAPGFIAITGETGAGKSIIIGALQLLLGERADKSLIRTGADSCTVEAVFTGDELIKLNRASRRSRCGTSRAEICFSSARFPCRRKPPIHQRLAHDARRPEKSRRRIGRSSRTARSSIVAYRRSVSLRSSMALPAPMRRWSNIKNIIDGCRNYWRNRQASAPPSRRANRNSIFCGISSMKSPRRI